MRRNRECNKCDCRDEPCGGGFAQETPVCCSECVDWKSPCFYVARFGCSIFDQYENRIARDNDILKRVCDFADEPCTWVGLGMSAGSGDVFINELQPADDLEWTEFGCTWDDSIAKFAGAYFFDLNQGLNPWGFGWTLKLESGGASFTSGDNHYQGTWTCDAENTLVKISGDPRLPPYVCISPFWAANQIPSPLPNEEAIRDAFWACPPNGTCVGEAVWETVDLGALGLAWAVRSSTCEAGCSPAEPLVRPDLTLYGPSTAGYTTTCEAGTTGQRRWILDDCDYNMHRYNAAADRCYCGDPTCECLDTQQGRLTCGPYSESATFTPCVDGGNGLDGVDSPAGPTYGDCQTILGREVCVNWYCRGDGLGWAIDVYLDGDLCESGLAISHTKCPLTFTDSVTASCDGCDVCVGDDCEPTTEVDCCPTPVPTTLTVTDGTTTHSLLFSGGVWSVSDVTFIGCAHADIQLSCLAGSVWQVQVSANSGAGGSFSTVTCSPTGDCDPMDLTCSVTGPCDGLPYAIDITP